MYKWEGDENKEHAMIYNDSTNMVAAWKIGKTVSTINTNTVAKSN